MAHFALAQVQCAQRLMPSLQTMQIFGNTPLQSLAFMQACGGFAVDCALSGALIPTIAITPTEKIKRSRLTDILLISALPPKKSISQSFVDRRRIQPPSSRSRVSNARVKNLDALLTSMPLGVNSLTGWMENKICGGGSPRARAPAVAPFTRNSILSVRSS